MGVLTLLKVKTRRVSFVEIQFPFFVLITTSGAGLGEEQHVPSDLIFFLMA